MFELESSAYPHKTLQLVQSECWKRIYLTGVNHILLFLYFAISKICMELCIVMFKVILFNVSVHICMSLCAPPQAFQQWTIPSLGLCSRELFGVPRKFFFTLHFIFVWQKEGKLFVFVTTWLVCYSVCRRTTQAKYFGRGTHLESQRRKEGIGESAELMMPTLRDSTMSHPGENSHQVRVKAYYKG